MLLLAEGGSENYLVELAMMVGYAGAPCCLGNGKRSSAKGSVPYVHPKEVSIWEDNMKSWPPIEKPDIIFYLLHSKACDLQEVRAYKSLDSYNYLSSGLVGTVLGHRISDQLCYLKAEVGRSQSFNAAPHKAWAWTVRRLLHDIGFEHDKRERNSRLIEREDIVAWQQKYLHEIARHRQDGRKIFYLDETWVTAGHTVSKVWVDTTVASSHDAFMRGLSTGLKQPSGKGQRLIVTHIGSDEGFVDGCLDVFRGQKTGDYHEEMDGARFEKWFDGVLDKLPTGSVIVMDNASYHSRRLEAVPTTSSRKDDIRQWLTSKKISWDPKMVKKQLLDIVALVKPQHLKYRVDTAAETAGCTVVRLPPYHCEFNPIELIWAQIKNGVAARNTTFKIVDVGRLLNEEVDKVTTDNWINAVRHVIDIEATFRRGGATSAHIQPIVIQLDGEDTPSESDLSGVEPLDEA
ncbi:uncharacterized protein ISCGN_010423 [Ixodes scapularis]